MCGIHGGPCHRTRCPVPFLGLPLRQAVRIHEGKAAGQQGGRPLGVRAQRGPGPRDARSGPRRIRGGGERPGTKSGRVSTKRLPGVTAMASAPGRGCEKASPAPPRGDAALAPGPGAWEGAGWPGSSLPSRGGRVPRPWHHLGPSPTSSRAELAPGGGRGRSILGPGRLPAERPRCRAYVPASEAGGRGGRGETVLCGRGPRRPDQTPDSAAGGTLRSRAGPHPSAQRGTLSPQHGSSWVKSSQLSGG